MSLISLVVVVIGVLLWLVNMKLNHNHNDAPAKAMNEV